ncbi:MAG: replicative DNA helicase [Planctomycetaceae bacterium]
MTAKGMTPLRVPPQSIEAEVCVLGSMMLDAATIDLVVQINKADHFFRPAHAVVFQTLVEMRDAGKAVDLVLLKDELTRRNQLEHVGGTEYLVAMIEGLPSAANAEYYAKIVRDKAILRQIIRAGGDMAAHAFTPDAAAEGVVEEAEKRIFAISSDNITAQGVFLGTMLQQTFEKLESHNGRCLLGQPSGYPQLDGLTSGFQNGDLIILAARPSMGKTSLLLNMAEHMGVVEGKTVALFSLEMSTEQLMQRFLASYARVSLQKMRRGVISAEDWTQLQLAAGDLSTARIIIDDSADLSITQIRGRARRLWAQHRIDCIFVDYLQLVRFYGRSENRQTEVAEMSRGLKSLARELKIPVITAAQLNRKPADRPSHRPQMSDLRESGSIEQDADVIALLHREDYFHAGEEGYMESGITELILAKQRNGPTGTVPLIFREEFTRFESAAQ